MTITEAVVQLLSPVLGAVAGGVLVMVQQGRDRDKEELLRSHTRLVQQCSRWISLEEEYIQEIFGCDNSDKRAVETIKKNARERDRMKHGDFEWYSRARIRDEGGVSDRPRRRKK